MATILHKNLTSTDIHEPKGADTATVGQVYRADGSGSGTWIVMVPVGIIWDIVAPIAPTGFLFCDGKTIGDASSNATARANADQAALFEAIWLTFANTEAPILDSSGTASTRGLSAAADFAAHKRLPLPDLRERVTAGWDNLGTASRLTGISGSVNGNTAGTTGGEETHALVSGELASHAHAQQGTIVSTSAGSHSHTVTGSTSTDGDHTHTVSGAQDNGQASSGSAKNVAKDQNTNTGSGGSHSHTVTGTTDTASAHTHSITLTGNTASTGSGTAHNNVQPVFICPKIIFYGA